MLRVHVIAACSLKFLILWGKHLANKVNDSSSRISCVNDILDNAAADLKRSKGESEDV